MQVVIRTYGSIRMCNNLNELQNYLDNGYKVIMATKVEDSVIEYILEKGE